MVLKRLLGAIALAIATAGPPALAQEAATVATLQRPGTLVSADPVVAAPPGAQAWRIVYWTRSDDDRPLRVTGMVVAPREAAPGRARKVVAWAHGTSGVVERCALSSNPAFFAVTPALGEMIAAGYVVVAPDYPGLGSPMPHGYLAGRETARSVLDAVRAARQIPGAAAGRDFAVWGESQGGHAALWTAAEARAYARELRLVGTAAAAPPTDLPRNLEGMGDKNVQAMLLAYLTYSWSQRYGAPMDKVFNRIDRGVASRLARNNCIELDAKPRLGTIVGILAIRSALRNKDIAEIDGWSGLARRNSIAAGRVPGPVLIAQSAQDPIVSAAVTRDFAQALCRRGRAVWYEPLAGGDHARTAANSARATLDWIARRFAGERPASNCRRL
ncbi:alpha/beta fold hydrolase [Pelagerythrobacter marinus]|uniref:alpha/beta fold hydrolase n=1 Tax=Pelagerythrobacter marinus TaxID=538382 RepID=UPI00203733F6|nr:alpha/beta fold hydrolase [Pelagerythrobacter marinus]USA40705.1 lipase family protein [Pelagerythrobacter marinus]WPZ08123.1 alpha/beta fold hydrolase [Pelagerythrobacter marinus]